jgi:hypothetical protein
MAEKQVGEIRISKRIVRIGPEAYPLANISRVQTQPLVWRGKYATFYPLRQIAVVVLVVAAIVGAAVVVLPELQLNTDFDVEAAARQLAAIVAILGGIRLAWLLFVLFYRLLMRRQSYALIIETAGTQYAALTGTDRDEIHRIESEIIDAIEDPPVHERIVQVSGDVVFGDKVGKDKYQQSGSENKMIFNR